MDLDNESSNTPLFSPEKATKSSQRVEERKIRIPPHRMTPLKTSWPKIYPPLVEHLGLQVRMNIAKKAVELRTSSTHPASPGAIQKGADFITAFTLGFDLDDAIAAQPDALMMLRIQLERMNAAYFPTEREYSRRWGLDARRLHALRADSIVMHPGPMNRGLEISAEAADSPRSTVLEQVANGVSVRMAALYLLLAGAERDSTTDAAPTAGGDATEKENTR